MGTVKYSGPVASFHCPTEAEIRSLKVHFSPKQLGEGTPSPENVREIEGWDGVEVEQRGKNLLGNLEDGYFQTFIPKGTQLIASTDIPTSGNNQVRYYRADKTEIDYWTLTESYMDGRKKRTFSTIEDAYYWRYTYMTLNVQLEYGSTATSYESCRGNTIDYEFGVLGKNKLDPTWESGGINVSTGEALTDSASIRLKNMIKVFPSQTYKLSWSSTGRNVYRFAYKKDGTFSRYLGLQSANSQSITLNADEYYLWLYQYQNINEPENIQLELGSTATEYEPYDPNKTVYGGWVDLISGEVCEEYIAKDMGQINWNKSSSGNKFYIIGLSPNYPWQSDLTMYCSIYKFDGRNDGNIWYGDNYTIRYYYLPSGNSREIYIHDERYDNAQDFKTAMNGINLIYPLATPNTYHLAPTQLQTFLGHNNVWSNADYVEVEYDLHETQTILARKQFIVANQPHIVKPAAAPLQNFVTDVAAPLKEYKVYFEPVQEGSGDPSPDNIRPISSLEQLTLYRSGSFNLPKEYQEVEYIESNDGAYISVVLSAVKGDTIKLASKFQYLGNLTNNFWIGGNAGNFDNAQFEIGRYGNWYKGNGVIGEYNIIEGNFPNEIIECTIEKTTSKDISSWICHICHRYGGEKASDTRHIYYFRIYNNDNLIYNFIPCYRRIDKIPGFYDTINNNFYVNEGEGYFVTGSEIYSDNTQIININWSDSLGAIYGGYLDLVKGEIVEEWHKIVADGVNVKCNSSYMTNDVIAAGIVYLNPVGKNSPFSQADINVFMDTIPIYTSNYEDNHLGVIQLPYATCTCAGNQYIVFRIANRTDYPEVTDANTCKEFVNNWLQEHPTTIVYELKTPIVHTLTPTQLKTLRGTNNIWSNSNGDITVQFWAH